jgi:plastocyanin
MPTKVLATSAACLALLVAGCGSSDDKSGGGGSAAPASSSSGAVAVSIKNIQFDPKTVTVKVGQTIQWTNDDGIAHNVTAKEGADFKSDNLNKGDTFDFKADKAGTIKYVCTIHPGQNGEITVQ